jgi:lysophospholipid acyltransferase (LPLAT)-like uncharacterized protein
MRKIGWFDIKTKFKKIIRSVFYTKFGQELICYLVIGYIKLVYYSSREIIIIDDVIINRFKNRQPIIINSWHHQIMMTPFVATQIKKFNQTHQIASLASKHGDGRFIGRIMEKFNVINIAGSTRDGRKSSRGIDMHGLKEIFRVLKSQLGIAITPDGPRGPSKKINGEVIKIAKLSGVPIVPVGIGYSSFFELKTWDKLRIPLPFGAVCYYYGDLFLVDKNTKEEEISGLNLLLEEKINFVADAANEAAK